MFCFVILFRFILRVSFIAAGPESLEDYFQKGALLGRHYIFGMSIPGQIHKDCSRAYEHCLRI